jgi:uncharacterized membrane protein
VRWSTGGVNYDFVRTLGQKLPHGGAALIVLVRQMTAVTRFVQDQAQFTGTTIGRQQAHN